MRLYIGIDATARLDGLWENTHLKNLLNYLESHLKRFIGGCVLPRVA